MRKPHKKADKHGKSLPHTDLDNLGATATKTAVKSKKAGKPIRGPKKNLSLPKKSVPRKSAGTTYSDADISSLKKAKGDKFSKEEAGRRKRDQTYQIQREQNFAARDISPLPFNAEVPVLIDWEARNASRDSLQKFCETYLPTVFYHGWSKDQIRCIQRIEDVFREGGRFALAMPRGGGKTALVRAGLIWGTANGYRRFPFLIASSQPKSTQSLRFIKTYWYQSKQLLRDFPEVAYPLKRLENRAHLAKGQTYRGQHTHCEWGADTLRYPCTILTDEVAEMYEQNIPGFTRYLEDFDPSGAQKDGWVLQNAGIIVRTSGIDGSIRGDAEIHPITLEQPRPDLVVLDDIQKDEQAGSPTGVQKLVTLIDGAVQGLGEPGNPIAGLMPCTVIMENDVADQYLDRKVKPEWRGERCKMVISWPAGITDTEISLDTEAGRLWTSYDELRNRSYNERGDISLATELYAANREVMDKDFVVSWEDRYDRKTELSPQQHAMNLRITNPYTFPAEFQNRGKRAVNEGVMLLTKEMFLSKTTGLPKGILSPDIDHVVSFIDTQNEILFYMVLAVAPDFTGSIIDYGTYPEVPNRVFYKSQTHAWNLLTGMYYRAYPNQASKIDTTTKIPHAPLEPKIYHALTKCMDYLSSKEYSFVNDYSAPRKIDKFAIDTRWGKASATIKKFCREYCSQVKQPGLVIPYLGQYVNPTHKQYSQYTRTPGWTFEDQINPLTKDVRWIEKPDATGQRSLNVDVNLMKTFALERLISPPGTSGSISVYDGVTGEHVLLANHLCDSEYYESLTTKDITKDIWSARDNDPDNDLWDSFVGCCALASRRGAYVRASHIPAPVSTPRKLSDVWNKKRQKRQG